MEVVRRDLLSVCTMHDSLPCAALAKALRLLCSDIMGILWVYCIIGDVPIPLNLLLNLILNLLFINLDTNLLASCYAIHLSSSKAARRKC